MTNSPPAHSKNQFQRFYDSSTDFPVPQNPLVHFLYRFFMRLVLRKEANAIKEVTKLRAVEVKRKKKINETNEKTKREAK